MKKIIYFAVFCLFVCACSDRIEKDEPTKNGVQLTISATIGAPAETKTTYARESVGISVNWEADEAVTLVSFDESGITAIDNFTSTGAAGRTKAEFTGVWNGNPGDKVVALYPALSTGTTLYQNVSIGSSEITISYQEHGLFSDISKLKNWDVMIGEVSITAGTASVTLSRKIAVFEFHISGFYPYDSSDRTGRYLNDVGVSAHSMVAPKLFANEATLAVTKASYSGNPAPSSFQTDYQQPLDPSLKGTGTYYYPVLANGILDEGDRIKISYHYQQRDGRDWEHVYNAASAKILTAPFEVIPGNIYKITGVEL